MNAQPQLHPNGEDYADGEVPTQWALPHTEDAERAIFGAAMLSKTALAEVRPLLTGPDFYVPKHEQIWEAITTLADAGRPADPLVVAQSLGEQLHRIGGAPYLHTCSRSPPPARPDGGPRSCWTRPTPAASSNQPPASDRSAGQKTWTRRCVRGAESKGWTDPPLGTAAKVPLMASRGRTGHGQCGRTRSRRVIRELIVASQHHPRRGLATASRCQPGGPTSPGQPGRAGA